MRFINVRQRILSVSLALKFAHRFWDGYAAGALTLSLRFGFRRERGHLAGGAALSRFLSPAAILAPAVIPASPPVIPAKAGIHRFADNVGTQARNAIAP